MSFYGLKLDLAHLDWRLLYYFAKREDGADGHFEVLEPQWNTDNCDAENEAECQMQRGNLPPTTENPYQIHNHGYATGLIRAIYQLMTKWPQGVRAQFEQLNAKWYAYDCDAHQQSHQIVNQGDDNPAKDKPENVAKRFHIGSKDTERILFPQGIK